MNGGKPRGTPARCPTMRSNSEIPRVAPVTRPLASVLRGPAWAAIAAGLVTLEGCSGEPASATTNRSDATVVTPTSISGVVQKGPFVRGSTVTVQQLDATLAPTGQTFEVATKDDQGDFDVPVNLSSQYVEVIATGYYFDELTNQLSSGPLTLRTIADVSGGGVVNVNLLTSMSEPLVRSLVGGGLGFSDATFQAESTVLTSLGIAAAPGSSFAQVSLTGTAAPSATLLAVSLIVEQYARSIGPSEVAQLTQLLSEVGAAAADAGGGDSTLATLSGATDCTAAGIDTAAVSANLTTYYASLGVSVTLPPFESIIAMAAAGCDDAGSIGDAPDGTVDAATDAEDVPDVTSRPACDGGGVAVTSDAGTSVVQLAAGDGYTCDLTRSGDVSCLGDNDGLLSPTTGSGFVSISGGLAGCAINTSGNLICDGVTVTDSSMTPLSGVVQVSGQPSFALSAAICATLNTGEVVCFNGNLGYQTPSPPVFTAVPFSAFYGDMTPFDPGFNNAVEVAVTLNWGCVRTATGSVVCNGPCDGTQACPNEAAVVGLSDAVQLAGGAYDICALRQTGAVVCWGANNVGQLGAGLPTAYSGSDGSDLVEAQSATPVEVLGLQGVRSIAGGGDTFCAVAACGTVACWGDNQFGEAGDGTLPPAMCSSPTDSGCVGKSVPTEVLGITNAISVTIGSRVACALRPREVDCWGSAQFGQFGDGGTLPTPNGSLGIPIYPTPQVVLTF
jgi:hypothetical protein